MATIQNTEAYTSSQVALSIMAGWIPAPKPPGLSAQDRWEIVAAALRAAGCENARPMPSMEARHV